MMYRKMGEKASNSIGKNFSGRLFLVVLCLSLVGCAAILKPEAKGNMREYVHPNGLIVKLPDALAATTSGEGFIVEPADGSNENVRRPTVISVDFHKNGSAPKDEAETRTKRIGDRAIKYVIKENEGGSGGAEYDFSAWESVPNGFVSYEQREQSEDSQPTFEIVWQAIENTRVRK